MRPPNLLFLMSDQQRADTVAPGTPCPTPNLDGLAAGGTRFERCYAPNPICSPTRASLMTGLLPHAHGMVDCTHTVPDFRARLLPDLPFWPRLLQQAGYRTGYFGKWHIERSNRLENFGFDTYAVEGYQQLKGLVSVAGPMDHRISVRQPGYGDFLVSGVVDQPVERMAEYRLYSDGINFLHEAAAAPEQPWLLCLSTEAPHDPYIALRDHFDRIDRDAILPPPSFEDELHDRPGIYRRIQRAWRSLEWPDFADASACYYANCAMLDDQVGRILATLDELGMAENTIVVYTSDHGDYLGAHRLLLKGIPAFEEAYRVPLIIRGPGIARGRTNAQIVSLLGLGSTLLSLTSGDEFPCQGRSFQALLEPDASPEQMDWASEAFAECHGQRFFYTQRILWQEQMKYVFNGFDEDELYDLDADPHELRNLAADPAQQPMLDAMAARMWEIMRETGDDNMTQAQYGMFRFAPVGPEAGG